MLRRLLAVFAPVLALLLALTAPPLGAQDQATLVSDRLDLTGGSRLVASGNVEVFFQGRRLRASRITYDQATDRLTIEGPIVLTDATGEVLILASQADLAADLTEGSLTSARMVLNQQLQLAANRMTGSRGAIPRWIRSSPVLQGLRRAAHTAVGNPRPPRDPRPGGTPALLRPRLLPRGRDAGSTSPACGCPTHAGACHGLLMPSLRTTTLGTASSSLFHHPRPQPRPDADALPHHQGRPLAGIPLPPGLPHRRDHHLRRPDEDETLPGRTRGYLDARGAFDLPDGFRLTFGLQAARTMPTRWITRPRLRPARQRGRTVAHHPQRLFLGPDHQLPVAAGRG